jgi:hypothetical protein
MKTTTTTNTNTTANNNNTNTNNANNYYSSSIDYENDSYEKIKIYDTNYEDYFCNVDNTLDKMNDEHLTNTYTNQTAPKKKSYIGVKKDETQTTTTCSTCSGSDNDDDNDMSSSLSSFSSRLSIDSILNETNSRRNHNQSSNHVIRKIKPKISSVRRKKEQEQEAANGGASAFSPQRQHNRLKNKQSASKTNKNRNRRHHHRQHDYFLDDDDTSFHMGNGQYYELEANLRYGDEYLEDEVDDDDMNKEMGDEFNIDEFVQELNVNFSEKYYFKNPLKLGKNVFAKTSTISEPTSTISIFKLFDLLKIK